MTDDTQARLEKLKQIEEKRRARSRRFLEKAKQDGKKQLSAIISGEAYDQLCRIRDATQLVGKSISFGLIIERALAFYAESLKHMADNGIVNTNGNTNHGLASTEDQAQAVEPSDKPIQETQAEVPAPMPNRLNKPAYKKWLFDQISELRDLGFAWVDIERQFNESGVKSVYGKTWGRGLIRAFYDRELKKLTKKPNIQTNNPGR